MNVELREREIFLWSNNEFFVPVFGTNQVLWPYEIPLSELKSEKKFKKRFF